jgi:type IV pilus assembly protein PilY1
LHAVDASLTGATAGRELFAYVPSGVITGPSGTPSVDGIAALADPNRRHYFYVNATPRDFDVDFSRTQPIASPPAAPDWRTLLIGGLGKGGRSYYALDVTDTNTMAAQTEEQLATRVLWEFTDPEMGFTFGDPIVVKTRKYGWVAIFTSGYNNNSGKGYIFIVNPRTGALIERIGTGVGSATEPAGLAWANTFIPDRTDGTADAVYAGDLLGNLWRLDLTKTDAGNYTFSPVGDPQDPEPTTPATPIARLIDASSGNPQPVTTRPLIVVARGSNKRIVTVGTGRLLDSSDISSTQPQDFYSITDGFGATFGRSLPTGLSYPVTRDNLVPNTDPTQGVSVGSDKVGWYLPLGARSAAGSQAWRLILNYASLSGTLLFSTDLPGGGRSCSPSGVSRLYALNAESGRTALSLSDVGSNATAFGVATGNDPLIAGIEFNRRIIGSQIVSVNGQGVGISSDAGGGNTGTNLGGLGGGAQRINWRELPVTD